MRSALRNRTSYALGNSPVRAKSNPARHSVMIRMNLISIITCIHNQRYDLFLDCAQSVARQAGPIEWIIVDDGSDAEFSEAYNNCLENFPAKIDVKVLRVPHNIGLSQARNQGLRLASGDWIVVLDSDDYLASTLSHSLHQLPSEAALACFAVRYFGEVDAEYRTISRWRGLYSRFGKTAADPFLWFDFYYHGIIARRQVINNIGGYNDDFIVGEDQDILLRACEAIDVESVFFCDEVGYHYRDNPQGVCATRWDEVEENYGMTMVAAARRRGAMFTKCRMLGTISLDGADIDAYTYLLGDRWLSWQEFVISYRGENS